MPVVYKDMTFCVNQKCKKRCGRFLTEEIEKKAIKYRLPLACSVFICLDKGEDGVYRMNEDNDEKMS
jgi:hypothetical protein